MRFSFRAILLVVGTLLALPVGVTARPLSVYETTVTRDPTGAPPPTRADYLKEHPLREMRVYGERRVNPRRDEDGSVVVAVNHDLLADLRDEFTGFAEDIAGGGYDVVLLDVEGGTPEEFKDLLVERGGDDLAGVVLAGELPLAWFEGFEYFESEDEPDNHILREYPIDLFFMDLDGEWDDTSGNGIYDRHSGAWEPDIWLGRLPAYNLSRLDEVELVAGYLERVHAYRSGELRAPHRALNYVDDDWAGNAADWGEALHTAWGGEFTEADPESTSATGYRRHLESGDWELVQVAVHSTYDSHLFRIEGGSRWDYFRFRHLRDDITPRVPLYNLFACSAMNIARGNLCIGALYVFKGPAALGAVGTTKVGSMLFFEDYYRRLAEGKNFGEALKLWLTDHAHEPERPNWARSWFYGMTHFGDPTLKIRRGPRVACIQVSGDDDGDAVPDAGESLILTITLRNTGADLLEDIAAGWSCSDERVTLDDTAGFIAALEPDEEADVAAGMTFADGFGDGDRVQLALEMQTGAGEMWFDRVDLQVHSPLLELARFDQRELEGDGDGWVEAGERGEMGFFWRNIGGDEMAVAGDVRITPLSGGFAPSDTICDLAPLDSTGEGWSEALQYAVTDASPDEGLFLEASVRINGNIKGEGVLAIPAGEDFTFTDDFTRSPLWLRCYPVTPGYTDAWRWDASLGEEGGGLAFTGQDSADYPPHADAALELPLLMFAADAVLTFRHRMDVEPEWDGGVVEVNRGREWVRAEPDGGYNGTSVEIGSYPGGECWNGQFDWSDVRVPLEGPAGPLRVRFRFAADGNVEGEGWFIDDIRIEGTPLETPQVVLPPQRFRIVSVHPNPFNATARLTFSLPRAAGVAVRLLDITGRRAVSLQQGQFGAGVHTIPLQAGRLPSGVYYLELRAAGEERYVKVALVK